MRTNIIIILIIGLLAISCSTDKKNAVSEDAAQFNSQQEFHDGLKLFTTKGNYVGPEELDGIEYRDGNFYYKDSNGKMVMDGFNQISFKDCEFGYLNEQGDTVIKPNPSNLMRPYKGGMVMIKKGSTTKNSYDIMVVGYMDVTGKVIDSPDCRGGYSKDFVNDYALVRLLDGAFAYIDKTGKVIYKSSEGKEPYFSDFKDGMAQILFQVKSNHNEKGAFQYGFINTEGELIIKPRYDWTSEFENGITTVKTNNREFQIDKTGKQVGIKMLDNNFPKDWEYRGYGAYMSSENNSVLNIKKSDEKFIGEISFRENDDIITLEGLAYLFNEQPIFLFDLAGKESTEHYVGIAKENQDTGMLDIYLMKIKSIDDNNIQIGIDAFESDSWDIMFAQY